MKKKIFYSIITFVLVFSLIGCGKKEEPKKEEKEQEENVIVDKSLFKIKDKEFHLDTDKEYEGLKYKTSLEFKEINNYTVSSTYRQYNYQPASSSNYFYFRILFYQGKDIEFAREDYLGNEEQFEYKDVTINNIDFKMIDEERTDGTIHHYFVTKDGNTFIVDFISQNDIKDFENKVLDSLSF
jgi:predicted small lipoprotein YifL